MSKTSPTHYSATGQNNEHPTHLLYDEECGWYKFGGQKENTINPYRYEYLSPLQKDAVDYANKLNTECPTIFKKLYDTLMHFVGNKKDNERRGLHLQYDRIYFAIKFQLDVYLKCTELIGLILWGADGTHTEVKITEFTKSDGVTITLTIQSICYNLLNKYIKDENIDSVCSGKLICDDKNV